MATAGKMFTPRWSYGKKKLVRYFSFTKRKYLLFERFFQLSLQLYWRRTRSQVFTYLIVKLPFKLGFSCFTFMGK